MRRNLGSFLLKIGTGPGFIKAPRKATANELEWVDRPTPDLNWCREVLSRRRYGP